MTFHKTHACAGCNQCLGTSNLRNSQNYDVANAPAALAPGLRPRILNISVNATANGSLDSPRFHFAGASSGHLYNLALKIRLVAVFLLKVYIPISAKLLGYAPTRWLGWGENLPAGVAMQWSAWCSQPGYVLNALGSDVLLDYFDQIRKPILWLTATDDPIATPENVDDMLRLYQNASVTRHRIDPRAYGLKRIAHIDFFRTRNATLWPMVTEWLSQ